MKIREVTDQNNIIWKCTQPFSSANSDTKRKATEIFMSEDGSVPLVCTPNGGEQTVRLQVKPDWSDTMSDEELVSAIGDAKASHEE